MCTKTNQQYPVLDESTYTTQTTEYFELNQPKDSAFRIFPFTTQFVRLLDIYCVVNSLTLLAIFLPQSKIAPSAILVLHLTIPTAFANVEPKFDDKGKLCVNSIFLFLFILEKGIFDPH